MGRQCESRWDEDRPVYNPTEGGWGRRMAAVVGQHMYETRLQIKLFVLSFPALLKEQLPPFHQPISSQTHLPLSELGWDGLASPLAAGLAS